jgi:tetratricopeptide (TPR) repeat protein
MNLLGYSRLQGGDYAGAVAFFKLNAEAYPAWANAEDSLSDGYLAAGQKDLAIAAGQSCLDLLPLDTGKRHAREKLAELKGESK